MCCLHSSGRASGILSWFASWITFPLCPILAGGFSLISFARSARSGNPCAMLRSTIFSPWILVTAFVSLRTMNEYAHGRAAIHPWRSSCVSCLDTRIDANWSIDPVSHLPVMEVPERSGASHFIWRVNNRVARLLVRSLGYQRGSWTGELPDPTAVGRALSKGDVILDASELRGQFLTMTAKDMPKSSVTPSGTSWISCRATVSAAIIGPLTVQGTDENNFVLIETSSGREVARYGDPSR